MLANQIQHFKKGSYTMIKWDLSQKCKEFFNTCKSISVIHHMNKLKNKTHMVTSIDIEKTFDKIQHAFMINASESGHTRDLLQHKKGHI